MTARMSSSRVVDPAMAALLVAARRCSEASEVGAVSGGHRDTARVSHSVTHTLVRRTAVTFV